MRYETEEEVEARLGSIPRNGDELGGIEGSLAPNPTGDEEAFQTAKTAAKAAVVSPFKAGLGLIGDLPRASYAATRWLLNDVKWQDGMKEAEEAFPLGTEDLDKAMGYLGFYDEEETQSIPFMMGDFLGGMFDPASKAKKAGVLISRIDSGTTTYRTTMAMEGRGLGSRITNPAELGEHASLDPTTNPQFWFAQAAAGKVPVTYKIKYNGPSGHHLEVPDLQKWGVTATKQELAKAARKAASSAEGEEAVRMKALADTLEQYPEIQVTNKVVTAEMRKKLVEDQRNIQRILDEHGITHVLYNNAVEGVNNQSIIVTSPRFYEQSEKTVMEWPEIRAAYMQELSLKYKAAKSPQEKANFFRNLYKEMLAVTHHGSSGDAFTQVLVDGSMRDVRELSVELAEDVYRAFRKKEEAVPFAREGARLLARLKKEAKELQDSLDADNWENL